MNENKNLKTVNAILEFIIISPFANVAVTLLDIGIGATFCVAGKQIPFTKTIKRWQIFEIREFAIWKNGVTL